MNAIRLMCLRTVGRACRQGVAAPITALFVAAALAAFLTDLAAAEGGRLPLTAVWCGAVSPILPVLAALIGMDAWSGERRFGRLDALLSVAVRERELVLGKFFGVWSICLFALLLAFTVSIGLLIYLAPAALSGLSVLSFLPGLAGLAVQLAAACSVTVFFSAFCTHGTVAATLSLLVTLALPRGGFFAVRALAPGGATALGEMPFDAQAVDCATGVFRLVPLAGLLTAVAFFLFSASKRLMAERLTGRGSRSKRFSTMVTVVLAALASVLALALAVRLDAVVELPVGVGVGELSPRTRGILSDSSGQISVTCFLSRADPRFRSATRLLRRFAESSERLGGATLDLAFVDPRWDIGAAERLVRLGADEGSLVFEKGRRHAAIAVDDALDERLVASTLQCVIRPPRRQDVYWTVGHGERACGDYGPWGLSDIARDLAREGYANHPLDLARLRVVPEDCALIVIAGAKDDFARAELDAIEAYLRRSGRLLVLAESASGGINALLPSWGLRPVAFAAPSAPTLTGADVVVSEFSDHPVGAALKGSRVVLDRPVAFEPSAVAESGSGADKVEFRPVASVGGSVVAAAAERGGGAGDDLQIRPTRLVCVGDATFAVNAQLAERANANRDFFLNCVSYLSGSGAEKSSGAEVGRLVTGLDRNGRTRALLIGAFAVPVILLVILLLIGRILSFGGGKRS